MKFNEAIAELMKNPNEVYESIRHGYRYELSVSAAISTGNCMGGYFYLKVYGGIGQLIDQNLGGGAFNGNIHVDMNWEKVRKEVTFMTAIKAYGEGKNIICEYSLFGKRRYLPSRHGHMLLDSTDAGISYHEILEGKWYIEE